MKRPTGWIHFLQIQNKHRNLSPFSHTPEQYPSYDVYTPLALISLANSFKHKKSSGVHPRVSTLIQLSFQKKKKQTNKKQCICSGPGLTPKPIIFTSFLQAKTTTKRTAGGYLEKRKETKTFSPIYKASAVCKVLLGGLRGNTLFSLLFA